MFDPTFWLAVIAGLQQGKDHGPFSLMLMLCFGHNITVSIPNDPAAGFSAFVSCSDAGDRNKQPHLCQSDLLSIFTLFLPSLFLLPSALWEFSPSQTIINVHEHLPHCVSWHVCACVAKFSLLQGFSLCMREACWGGCVYECTWVGVNSIWGEENLLAAHWLRCVGGEPCSVACKDQDVGVQGHFS